MNKKITDIIDKQIKLLNNINSGYPERLPVWKNKTVNILSEHIPIDDLNELSTLETSSYIDDKTLYRDLLNDLKIKYEDEPEDILAKETGENLRNSTVSLSNKIFIVHGHDPLAKTEVARTLEKLDLLPIVLHEQPNEGKTIIEKFERDASQVSYAVVILTPDDIGYPYNKPDDAKARARQNVILELGYFSGILGRKNVTVLYKGDVEIPTDYLGVIYLSMDSHDAWKFNLARELKNAGLNVDLNKLIS